MFNNVLLTFTAHGSNEIKKKKKKKKKEKETHLWIVSKYQITIRSTLFEKAIN